jgi:4-amino-4-deoxy-L-arabinose transferase-like glycosyltransferase
MRPGDTKVRAPWASRHYWFLSVAVLGLAALNLFFRLDHEMVTQWDESRYAISAWEMASRGGWVGTTFLGELDYFNLKPPLDVWLIALSFKAFGVGLVSLRLASAVSAWLTVAVLMAWSKRCFGHGVALASGLVLGAAFGFIHVHAGRSATADAPFTLVVLLTVVTLWAAKKRPARFAWTGPLLAAAFLLRGMGVFMPLAIVGFVWLERLRRRRLPWPPQLAAVALFLAPVAAWALARRQIDGWVFLRRMVGRDFLERSLTVIEQHPGTPLFYLNTLVKHQCEWLAAGVASAALFPVPWRGVWSRAAFWRRENALGAVLVAWGGATLLIPTLMKTKLAWYVNPFYPLFALCVGWLVTHGLSAAWNAGALRWRRAALTLVGVMALATAEGKLISYSLHYRDVEQTVQGLLLAEGRELAGRRVFNTSWEEPEIFVAAGILGARYRVASGTDDFLSRSAPGDYLVSHGDLARGDLALRRAAGGYRLYLRTR